MSERLLAAAVASLNDVVSEIVCGLAVGDEMTKGWAFLVVQTLNEHSRSIGHVPHVTTEQIAEWADSE
jgi:hypothetical protein